MVKQGDRVCMAIRTRADVRTFLARVTSVEHLEDGSGAYITYQPESVKYGLFGAAKLRNTEREFGLIRCDVI